MTTGRYGSVNELQAMQDYGTSQRLCITDGTVKGRCSALDIDLQRHMRWHFLI